TYILSRYRLASLRQQQRNEIMQTSFSFVNCFFSLRFVLLHSAFKTSLRSNVPRALLQLPRSPAPTSLSAAHLAAERA
ncbi:hypothetical protein, partial [Trinickia fusca]|uniref:hypothetical protein n=1 Tax=Trinickia fusca TaxID=2419777 RepID=UPI001C7D0FCA